MRVAFGRRERPERRVDLGELAGRDALRADADLVQRPLQHELAGHDANRAGDRPRLRDDLVGRHGHVVAARRGDVAHRHDHRLDVARQHQLAPDDLRGDRRSARAVDPDDDGAHRRVHTDSPNPLHERLRPDDVAAGPIEGALPAGNRADGVQQRDAGAARARPDRARHARERVAVEPDGAGDRRRIVELILVAERVDEPGLERAVRQERSVVNHPPDVGVRPLA